MKKVKTTQIEILFVAFDLIDELGQNEQATVIIHEFVMGNYQIR